MENNKVNISCSWPIPTILFLAFFFAKILGYIDWSWWWVFSPLWAPLGIFIIIVVGCGVLWMISTLISLLTYNKW